MFRSFVIALLFASGFLLAIMTDVIYDSKLGIAAFFIALIVLMLIDVWNLDKRSKQPGHNPWDEI